MNEKKALLRYIDTASISELEKKLVKLEALEIHLTDPEVIFECKWIIRKIIGELEIRRQIAEFTSKTPVVI